MFASLGTGQVASIIGRYYAMDRDQRWERVEAAYNLIVDGEAEFTFKSATEALAASYERDERDEFVKASAVLDENGKTIAMEDGDAMVLYEL